jgi:site-specific recombinase XerD
VPERQLAKVRTSRAHVLPPGPDLRALRLAEDDTTVQRPTIAAIVERYLEWMAGNAAKDTVRTYTDSLRHFGAFLAMSGINAFEETADVLPATILEEWIVWCRKRPMHRGGRPLGPASVQTYFYAVSGCFKWAARRKLLAERFRWAEMFANATETLGKLYWHSARHDRRVPLLVAYVDAVPMPPMAASPGAREGAKCLELLRDRALLHLLLSSGMRRQEVLTLNRDQIEDGWATSAVIIGKGSRERTAFWDTETQQALRAYLAARTDPYPPVFIRLDNHRGAPGDGEAWRLSKQSCWLIVTGYSKLTGIPATPHAFRHAMASAMLNNDAPLELIQDLLGHANVNTTKHVYAAYEQRTLRKGFEKFNPTASEQVAELEAEQEHRRRTNNGDR